MARGGAVMSGAERRAPKGDVPLLRARQLVTRFQRRRPWFGSRPDPVVAVDGVDLTVDAGRTVGVVGESGSGKTTLLRTCLRLVDPVSGTLELDGRDLLALNAQSLRQVRRRMQRVDQDPWGSLNPRLTVGELVGEGVRVHGLAAATEVGDRVASALRRVGLDPDAAERRPHGFSGGERQRIAIARALAVEPALLMCDEPTSALDVSVRAQILNLLLDVQADAGLGLLLVSHDLELVLGMSHRVHVMYAGRVVESAPAGLLGDGEHPYTRELTAASRLGAGGLPEVPPMAPPSSIGCPFLSRCPLAEDRCREERPVLRDLRPGHQVACHVAS